MDILCSYRVFWVGLKTIYKGENMTEFEKLNLRIKALEAQNDYLKDLLVKRNKSLKEIIKQKLSKPSKNKLGMVVDVDNWAFYNIANNFSKHITEYETIIIPMSLIDSNFHLMWIMLKECDVVHFFCRGIPLSMKPAALTPELEKYGDTYDNFYKNYLKGKILTTCVYDHLFLDEELPSTQYWFSELETYYVSSNILFNIYNGLDIKYKPTTVITDGVNLDLFYPKNLARFDDSKRTINIGWVGNSEWNKGADHKGINTIIKPVVEKLQKQGYNVNLLSSDKIDKHIPIEQMVDYYEKIDIYVCASINEGTPNPVLESMACGVPVISTDVGIVRDALGEKQKQFILSDRSCECLETAIKKMIENPVIMKECSLENLESIKKWDWKFKSEDFERFIKNAVKKGKRL